MSFNKPQRTTPSSSDTTFTGCKALRRLCRLRSWALLSLSSRETDSTCEPWLPFCGEAKDAVNRLGPGPSATRLACTPGPIEVMRNTRFALRYSTVTRSPILHGAGTRLSCKECAAASVTLLVCRNGFPEE